MTPPTPSCIIYRKKNETLPTDMAERAFSLVNEHNDTNNYDHYPKQDWCSFHELCVFLNSRGGRLKITFFLRSLLPTLFTSLWKEAHSSVGSLRQ
jgi:hypothetical protein